MLVRRGLDDFNVREYGGVELERLGNNLVENILRHVGMKRYERSGIKLYDITDYDIGNLMDAVIKVNKGIDKKEGLRDYQTSIKNLLEVIKSMEGQRVKGSVVTSLRMSILEEIKLFKRENINFDDIWEL